MFATIKSLIPEPRQAEQPRRYVGRHRHLDAGISGTPDADDAAGADSDHPVSHHPAEPVTAAVGTASVVTASVGSSPGPDQQTG
jgi:hypothetical protein